MNTDRMSSIAFLTAVLLSAAATDPAIGIADDTKAGGDNVFALLINFNDAKEESAVQPAWTAHMGTVRGLHPDDHKSLASTIYVHGRKAQVLQLPELARKVPVSCFGFEGKVVKASFDHMEWATTRPIDGDFTFSPADGEALRARATDAAKGLATEGLSKVQRRALSTEATVLGVFDLDKDGKAEIAVRVAVKLGAPLDYEIIGSELVLEGVAWLHAAGSDKLHVLFDGLQNWESWPTGPAFNSVADFDMDGVGDVSMETSYGEGGLTMELYRLKNGRLESFFRTVSVGGC